MHDIKYGDFECDVKHGLTFIFSASTVAEMGPQLYQVASQLSKVTSSKLRVKVAAGGDPSFPLRVSLRGEQVLGLGKLKSGSNKRCCLLNSFCFT